MEAEQREEWNRLEQQAGERLRIGSPSEYVGFQRLLQILVRPAFDVEQCWEIVQNRKASEAERYAVIRTRWNKHEDLEKLRTPIARLRCPRPLFPTIEVQRLPLEAAWIATRLTALQSITLPVMVEYDSILLDGVSYELTIGNGFPSLHCAWSATPAGWHPLTQWVEETLETLEALGIL